jgi:hypothetical protein
MNDKRDGQGACYLKNGACRAKKRPGAPMSPYGRDADASARQNSFNSWPRATPGIVTLFFAPAMSWRGLFACTSLSRAARDA